jgi:CRP-like cAMP-binding protein
MSGVEQSAVRNRLLAALPPESFARIAPALERVELPSNLCLHGPGEPIGAVHFVEAGAVSLMTLMIDGNHVESGTVGREGFVGLPLLLGADARPAEARVQMPGAALRLGAARFRDAVEADAGLRLLLLRFTLAFHGLVAQTAACNARHQLEQRLARWMLIAHDRAESDELPLTHEFLSVMLGVRRAGVTVAGILRDEGLIHYDRGHVTILDRPGLEATSCECHGATRAEFTRLLGRAGAGGV